jgi:acyl carrier protein
VHAAGVLDDGVVESLSADQVRRVWRAKVEGAWHLHELTSGADLSAFVVFSSAAATLGSAGQGAYVAANAGVEELVRHRRGLGLPGVAIGWGLWETATDMTAGLDDAGRARLARTGVLPLSVDQGLRMLDAAIGLDRPVVLATRFNPPTLRTNAGNGMLPPLFHELVTGPVRTPGSASDADTATTLRARLAALAIDDQLELVGDLVRTHAATVLGHANQNAVADRAFKDLGFDSLTAVEFRNRLTAATGLRLPATLVFDHPTPAVLIRHLHGQLLDDGAIFAELDKVDAFVSGQRDPGIAERVADRLRMILARLDGRARAADDRAEAVDLSGISDEELFDVLEGELQ